MTKRKFDKAKHSAQKYRNNEKNPGKGGWGAPEDGMDMDYVKKDPLELKMQAKTEKPVSTQVDSWDCNQVSSWVNKLGPSFSDFATQMGEFGVNGRDLLSFQYEELEASLGKGMKTRKLWNEIQKLQPAEKMETEPASPVEKMQTDEQDDALSHRETFQTVKPVKVYKSVSMTESEVLCEIPRFHLVSIAHISSSGEARLGSPMGVLENGFCAMADANQNPNFKRVFLIRGEVWESQKQNKYKSQEDAMKAIAGLYSKFYVHVVNSVGCTIRWLGREDMPVASPVAIEQMREGSARVHFFKNINIETWNRFPELVVQRTTMNIAWNLFKEEAISQGIPSEAVGGIQQLFRQKKNKGNLRLVEHPNWQKVLTSISIKGGSSSVDGGSPPNKRHTQGDADYESQVKNWFRQAISNHDLQQNALTFSVNAYVRRIIHEYAERKGLGHQSIGEGRQRLMYVFDGKHLKVDARVELDRKLWISKAQKLKRESEKFVKDHVLTDMNFPASELRVGLIGPLGANIGRSRPKEVTEGHLVDLVAGHAGVEERPDASYRLHRQFLRYADSLTAALGKILEEEFDPDLVDVILTFFDGGSGDYIKNAKGSLAYETTGSKCLDFYASYKPSKKIKFTEDAEPIMNEEQLSSGYLDLMWKEHPLTTLRLVFHLGAAREGKQDLHGFYVVMHWLFKKHPYTLLANIHLLPVMNYFKAMLDVLDRVMEDDEKSREKRDAWYAKTGKSFKSNSSNEDGMVKFRESFLKGAQCYRKTEIEFARALLQRYDSDLIFRAIHRKVAAVFANCLKKDVKKKHNLSLACKWAPTEGGKHDKHLLMHEAIARQCFPPEADMSEFGYQSSLRNRLRKEMISPLRLQTKVTERLISTGRLDLINYEHVPGSSMRKNKKAFEKLDPTGYQQFLEDVASGKKKVKSGSVGPVELYMKVKELTEKAQRGAPIADTDYAIVNGQWESMIEKLKKKIPESQRNIVAAIDTSGSMWCSTNVPNQQCIDVAVAMGLVCLSLANGVYENQVLLYTTRCQTVTVTGNTLKERYDNLWEQTFSGGTSYGCILEEVKNNAVSLIPEEKNAVGINNQAQFRGFPGRVIILSDMEFRRGHDCSLKQAVNVFEPSRARLAELRGCSVDEIVNPEIVFWNIAASTKPARITDVGCSMVSGHSPVTFVDVLADAWSEMNRDVVTGQKQNDPLTVMLNTLNKPLFQKLRVVSSKEEAMDLLRDALGMMDKSNENAI